jgi:hypothetical protein
MTTILVANVKCGRCKIYRYEKDFLNSKNRQLKTCSYCRRPANVSKIINSCIHNKKKSQCIKCSALSLCEHNRRKIICIDCMEEDNKICLHNIDYMTCKICSEDFTICIHDEYNVECQHCNENALCNHKILKKNCDKCDYYAICSHNKFKNSCLECSSKYFCIHSSVKNKCKICNNSKDMTIKMWLDKAKKDEDYNTVSHIDDIYCKMLMEDYKQCYFIDCKNDINYDYKNDNLGCLKRKDKKLYYTKLNCVICCYRCKKKTI